MIRTLLLTLMLMTTPAFAQEAPFPVPSQPPTPTQPAQAVPKSTLTQVQRDAIMGATTKLQAATQAVRDSKEYKAVLEAERKLKETPAYREMVSAQDNLKVIQELLKK